jgi:alpha-1,6-mannosyltransferase
VKICDIVQFYSPHSGGVKRYINDKIKFLAGYPNIEHVVIVPAKADNLIVNIQTRIYNVSSPPLIGSESYRLLINKAKILDIIDRERPDIIEVGDPYYSAWIAIEAGDLFKCPVVGFYHSDYPRALVRTLQKYLKVFTDTLFAKPINVYLHDLYNRMEATLVPTKRFQDILSEIGIKNIIHIPLGYDSQIFYPRESKEKIYRELQLSDNTRLLLYIGRIAREKNIKSLFSMMEELNYKNEIKYHLLLVGDGELNQWVERNILDFNNITWLHYCDDTQRLAELYSSADLFIHAGHTETFGLVALESMACGTRVLAIQGGGLDEVLSIEKNKIFAQNPDGNELADKVREIINMNEDREVRLERSNNVNKNYVNSITYQKLLAVYHDINDRNHSYKETNNQTNLEYVYAVK